MRQQSRASEPVTAAPRSPARPPAAFGRRAAALALQRTAGNRATAGVLARWIKHPDAEKKGVVVPDVAAAEYNHFNPPKNE